MEGRQRRLFTEDHRQLAVALVDRTAGRWLGCQGMRACGIRCCWVQYDIAHLATFTGMLTAAVQFRLKTVAAS
jgi:hypothetical protein